MKQRPALLVSEGMLEAARAVWDHRGALGGELEVHVVDRGGTFLPAADAKNLVLWAEGGLTYEGNFFDALSENRIASVLPLLEHTDGTVQGLLEFQGVAYAGCGMTSAILAHNRDHCKAVLDSLGLKAAAPGNAPSHWVAVAGNEELVAAAQPADAEVEEFARRVYHGLGMGGWASVEVVRDQGLSWRSVEVQPDLRPDGRFLTAFASRGLDLEALLTMVLRWGQVRHDAELGLKSRFKDGI